VYFGAPNGGSILSGGVNNGISFCAADMLPATGQVSYGTVGTTPNQIFVIDFNGVPEFSGGGTHSGQIQIFENGHVEIHVTSASSATRTKTLGLKNSTGTVTAIPAGYSSATWTVASPVAFSFTYSTTGCNNGGLTFTWLPNAPMIIQVQILHVRFDCTTIYLLLQQTQADVLLRIQSL
jgi:hypothetical protein